MAVSLAGTGIGLKALMTSSSGTVGSPFEVRTAFSAANLARARCFSCMTHMDLRINIEWNQKSLYQFTHRILLEDHLLVLVVTHSFLVELIHALN